jgi:replication-associated recombination protein RarA
VSYQVFARKYRPKSFNDVLGQDHVVRTLRNAIEQKLDMAAHAQAIDHQQVLRTDLQRRVATLLTES